MFIQSYEQSRWNCLTKMSIYKKKVSSGVRFFKKGEDIKDGDVVTIANEGEQEEGQFGPQDVFLIQLNDGEEGAISLNQTSLNSLIDGYGEDSKKWIGKKAKIVVIKQNVKGKFVDVFYFVHPDAEMVNDSGQFVISTKDSDIPAIDAEADANAEAQMAASEDQEN